MPTVRTVIAMMLMSVAAFAQELRYRPDDQYIRLWTADSIELSTQLCLAIRASVDPKEIEPLDAPELGFQWKESAGACRIRAVPTAGIDGYGHTSVGYYLELRSEGFVAAPPKACIAPIQKLHAGYLSEVVASGQAGKVSRDVYVRDFRSIDPKAEVTWRPVQGKELMQARKVIDDIAGKR
jgi:hypothetical protein